MKEAEAMLKPCPFCGSKIKHIISWARSFKPPRPYHEWHHVDDDDECPVRHHGKIVASATDDEALQARVVKRWNTRAAALPGAAGPDAVREALERINPADEIIGQIEKRFPDWKGFRDLVDCIDVTLHRLRGGQ